MSARKSERFADWVLFGPDANVRVEGTLPLTLPTGRKVDVKRRLMGFEQWKGVKPKLPRIWSSKGYLNHSGEPLFAELVILRMLEKEGWEGVWVNNFKKQFLKGLPEISQPCQLPDTPHAVFREIERKNGGRRGCWDVFAWRRDEVVFAEAKRMEKDHIRESQRAWLDAALEVGIPLSAFLIVEWKLM
jgi:hypothetical protein